MKYTKMLLVLTALICLSSTAYADTKNFQKTLENKVNLSGTDSVAAKANSAQYSVSSPYSELLQNPLVNSALTGYGSMIQGASGGSYSADEQSKQQLEYARQQFNNADAKNGN